MKKKVVVAASAVLLRSTTTRSFFPRTTIQNERARTYSGSRYAADTDTPPRLRPWPVRGEHGRGVNRS